MPTVSLKPDYITFSDEELKQNVFSREGELAKNQFVTDGKLNMRLILERFKDTYTEVCGPLVDKFKEKRTGGSCSFCILNP